MQFQHKILCSQNDASSGVFENIFQKISIFAEKHDRYAFQHF